MVAGSGEWGKWGDVFDTLSVKRLWDIQVETSNRLLGTQVWRLCDMVKNGALSGGLFSFARAPIPKCLKLDS